MSVIGKKPLIETIVESLTDTLKTNLLTLLNNTSNHVFKSLIDDENLLNSEACVEPVYLQIDDTNCLNGFYVNCTAGLYLLEFSGDSAQKMAIYIIDISKRTCVKVQEYLDINELRRVLNDSIMKGDIDDMTKDYIINTVEEEDSLQVFENIVDKDGHKRFIEGEISLHSDMPSGVSKTYGKWSLSGTHLMIVLCLSIENTTTLSNGTSIGTCTLPSWISDKIYPVWQSLWIERKDFSAFADDWTAQTFTCSMRKGADNTLLIAKTGNLTLTSDKNVRIYFDLLIDNK